MIKEIIVWIFIFIVGSLIVSFLIYPNSFYLFKENIRDMFQGIKSNDILYNQDNLLKIKDTTDCSVIEMVARSEGLGKIELKEMLCKNICGKESLDYYNFECDKDKLYCYCLNN